MLKSKRDGWRFLAALALCLVAWTGLAQAQTQPQTCPLPPAVSTLITATERALYEQEKFEAAFRATVNGLSGEVLRDELLAAELEIVLPQVLDLLTLARRAAHGPELTRAMVIKSQLDTLRRAVTEVCETAPPSADGPFQQARFDSVERDAAEGRNEDRPVFTAEDAMGVGLLTLLLCGLIVLFYLIDSGFRWVMALIYNRKSCRIAASLKVGDHTLDGSIVTLGRGGCRFAPFDAAQLERTVPSLRSLPGRLVVRDGSFDVEPGAIHVAHVDMRFKVPLSLAAQSVLLEASTITPFYVRKTRPIPPEAAQAKAGILSSAEIEKSFDPVRES